MTTRGEFERLAALAPLLAPAGPGVPVGAGDDAAVVTVGGQDVVVCVDVIVDGVHFLRHVSSPVDIGWKALAVNLSDIAAMGAAPVAAVVGLQLPAEEDEAVVEGVYRGLAEAAKDHAVAVVGGDTVRGPALSLSVTVLGEPGPRVVTRAGAAPGDRVALVGELGRAAAAVWGLESGVDVPDPLLAAHRRPRPLVTAGLALAEAAATAMIDVSDGLGADAGHVAEASGVALRLDPAAVMAAVPDGVERLVGPDRLARVALGGGEDFALLATVPAASADRCAELLDQRADAPWRWVGVVEHGAGEVWMADGDDAQRVDDWGYQHR